MTDTIKTILVLLGALVLLSIVLNVDAEAQQAQQCAPFDKMRTYLATKFNETVVGGGSSGEELGVFVFGSPGGATWTIVAVDTNNRACLIGEGQNWFQDKLPPAGEAM